jgi:hypothetical protein
MLLLLQAFLLEQIHTIPTLDFLLLDGTISDHCGLLDCRITGAMKGVVRSTTALRSLSFACIHFDDYAMTNLCDCLQSNLSIAELDFINCFFGRKDCDFFRSQNNSIRKLEMFSAESALYRREAVVERASCTSIDAHQVCSSLWSMNRSEEHPHIWKLVFFLCC